MFIQNGNIIVFKEMVKHSPFASRDSLDAFNRMLWQPAQDMISQNMAGQGIGQGIGKKFPPLFPGMPVPGAGAPFGAQAFFPMMRNPIEFAQGVASAVVGMQLTVMGWALEVTVGSLAAVDQSIEKANRRLKENDPATEFARSLVKTTYLAVTEPDVPSAAPVDPEKSW